MSYDLELVDERGRAFPMPQSKHIGGTMPVGGYTKSAFNITYNYSWFYYKFLSRRKGLRWLYGKTGKQTQERLKQAIKELGTDLYFRYPRDLSVDQWEEENRLYDYWAPTHGNAGAALVPLHTAAKKFPGGIWQGD